MGLGVDYLNYLFKPEQFVPQPTTTIKKGKRLYYSKAIYLDTETAHNHNEEQPKGWISSWCFAYEDDVVCGRKPSELLKCLDRIVKINNEPDAKHIIFVHNLSYDLVYLFKSLIEQYGKEFDCLAIAPHKFITFTINAFEFRCTYKLSNKSLEKWSNDLNVKHKKKVGTYDYDKIIYQDTPLSFQEWKYQIYDVLALKECVEKQNEIYGYNLATMPLTSTGYIRKDIRNESRKDKKNYDNFVKTALDERTNELCVREFSGGMTHGNRFLKAKTIIFLEHYRGKCRKGIAFKELSISHDTIYHFFYHYARHRDFRSHYPTQQRNYRCFPVSKFAWIYSKKDNIRMDDIFKTFDTKCSLIEITFKNLRVKKEITIPFAQYSKFYQGRRVHTNFVTDNGRILEMNGISTVVLTEYDLLIIKEQYTFQYRIENVYQARKDFLPKFMINSVDKYFLGKSHYKNVVQELKEQGYKEDSDEIFNANMDLMKSKNGLNGIYGCTATAIVREEYKPPLIGENWRTQTKSAAEQLEAYYKNRNNFNRYQFGIYTTSLARYELYEYIKTIGYENVIYCDTDSIFYHSSHAIEKRIEELNEKKHLQAIENKAFVTMENGKQIFYDVFEDEKEEIYQFRFLHSKCYAYKENGELHCTIAGVTQRSRDYLNDGITRVKELGNINQLKHGKVFEKCGGTSCKYVDSPCTIEDINGHITEYSDSAIISNVSKTLKNINEELDIEYIEEWSVE